MEKNSEKDEKINSKYILQKFEEIRCLEFTHRKIWCEKARNNNTNAKKVSNIMFTTSVAICRSIDYFNGANKFYYAFYFLISIFESHPC